MNKGLAILTIVIISLLFIGAQAVIIYARTENQEQRELWCKWLLSSTASTTAVLAIVGLQFVLAARQSLPDYPEEPVGFSWSLFQLQLGFLVGTIALMWAATRPLLARNLFDDEPRKMVLRMNIWAYESIVRDHWKMTLLVACGLGAVSGVAPLFIIALEFTFVWALYRFALWTLE